MAAYHRKYRHVLLNLYCELLCEKERKLVVPVLSLRQYMMVAEGKVNLDGFPYLRDSFASHEIKLT